MKNNYINTGFLVALFCILFSACDDTVDAPIEELKFDRAFTPLELEATVRNGLTVELEWKVKDSIDSYVIEISEGNLEFNTIVHTVTVAPDEIPYSIALAGDTQYSVRVKAVEEGTADSKWIATTFKTDPENILFSQENGDVTESTAIIKWPAGSDVTHFLIMPGEIERPITADEKEAGEATIEELVDNTLYNVTLKNNGKTRGIATFETLVDGIDVYFTDDLNAKLSAAQPGDKFVLHPGDYQVYTGSIVINKSILISGYLPYDKPKVHVTFVLEEGVQDVEVKNLEMIGDGSIASVFEYSTSAVGFGSLKVSNCDIHDYTKALVGASSMTGTVESISMSDLYVYDILSSGGDFIDFRSGYLANLSLTNSTFVDCAPGRDFIRLDNSSATYPGKVSKVLIDNCTLYGVSDANNKRILYVRFETNELTVRNTIIAETEGIYTNQALSSQPSTSNNNYFNAPGFHTPDYVSNVKIDSSPATLDPEFENADAGNFTVKNQDVIDEKQGDPRWLP